MVVPSYFRPSLNAWNNCLKISHFRLSFYPTDKLAANNAFVNKFIAHF